MAPHGNDTDGGINKNDQGYFFSCPLVEQRNKMLKNGNTVINYYQTGVIYAGSPGCPWYNATLFAQGTMVKDAEGKVIQEVALYETVDAQGDLTWTTMWRTGTGPTSLRLRSGTGKWLGITGKGDILGWQKRADDHLMPCMGDALED